MNRRGAMVFLILLLIGMAGVRDGAAANGISDEVRAHWKSTRNIMLTIAAAVPEDKYDFKPTPEVRSFRDQFVHIVEENYFFMGFVSGQRNAKPAVTPKTKAEIIKALTDSYDFGAKALAGLNDSNAMEIIPVMGNRQGPRWSMALMNIVDNMDHYGNLVVYMRLNGITPPSSQRR